MNLKHHKTLSEEKWATFSFGKQLIMIANELNRAKNWILKNDSSEVSLCYERAMELLYLTIANTVNKTRLLELVRFKEMLAGLYISRTPELTKNKQMYDIIISFSSESYNMLNPVRPKT